MQLYSVTGGRWTGVARSSWVDCDECQIEVNELQVGNKLLLPLPVQQEMLLDKEERGRWK